MAKRLGRPEKPDIEISASVEAGELRFEKVPETAVRFRGNPERETVSGTERENLPDEVRPGVTYRNPKVRLRIATAISGELSPAQDRESRDNQTRRKK
ncbi:MAG: hypothetical protein AB1425_02905 [Actinomycetota bacterium]